jgi:predicted nucleotidyltransferase
MIRREYSRSTRAEGKLAAQRRPRDKSSMKMSLDHLPAGKRRELDFVVEILTEEFAKAIATRKAAGVKDGQLLHIVLFGSYARGDWVEDPVGRYFSDYDLLVVVSNDKLTDVLEFWEGAEKRLLAELSSGQRLRTPVNFIVHSLADVNEQLARGRYFFVDIVRDGITLMEVPGQPFVEPKPLAPATALEEARGYYEAYFTAGAGFLDTSGYAGDKGRLKEVAFLLHQATENFYTCLLLVLTLYTPKSHNLVRLRSLSEPLDARLAEVWPTETKFHKRCFELLRAAYVKARYSRQYKVTAEELAWVQARIEQLQALVRAICEARIATLEAADVDSSRG